MIMDNLEIIILSTVVVTLFSTFIIVTYRELVNAEKNPRPSEESGPRANMIKFIGRLFDESATKKMTTKQKEIYYRSIKRTIADMESDGVYFPEEIKEKLRQKREELTCQYSNLPSVKSYLSDDELSNVEIKFSKNE